jgi:hypothetical protein
VTVTGPVSQVGGRNQAAGRVMILQCENGGAQSLVAAFGGFVHDGERTASYERDGGNDSYYAFVRAWRAHLKHSSATARYSAAVFIKRFAFLRQFCCKFLSLSALGPTQQRNYERFRHW